jgi:hypothetical protein
LQTWERVLAKVNAAAVERALLAWQAQVLGPVQDDLVIVDGKAIRHAKVELVSAVSGKGRWLGKVSVAEGSHEIPAARALLTKVDVTGKRSPMPCTRKRRRRSRSFTRAAGTIC